MKIRIGYIILLMGVMFLVASCAAGAGQPEQGYTLLFRTEPDLPKANEAVRLVAELKGLEADGEGSIEIRSETEPREGMILKQVKTGVFAGEETFTKPGKYTVIIHVYSGDIHEWMKQDIIVE